MRPGTGDAFPSRLSECCSSPETVTNLRSPLWSRPSSRCPRFCPLVLQSPDLSAADLDHVMIPFAPAQYGVSRLHTCRRARLGCCPTSIVHVARALAYLAYLATMVAPCSYSQYGSSASFPSRICFVRHLSVTPTEIFVWA